MGDRNAYSSATPVVTHGGFRDLKVYGGAIPLITTDMTLNRTTGLFVVPAGFTLVMAGGFITDIDTNATPLASIIIGDSGDNDRFLTTDTAGRTGAALGALASTGSFYRFTADTEITLTFSAAAATAAAGTITYWMVGFLA